MYQDNPRIHVLPVKDEREARELGIKFGHATLRLGLYSGHRNATLPGWDKLQYDQAGVPFDNRWSAFKCGYEGPYQEPTRGYDGWDGFTFLHEDAKRGFLIADKYKRNGCTCFPPEIVRPDLIAWYLVPMMQACEEIHVIDSSWLSIAESVPTKGKLFFHRYARPGGVPPTLRKNWTIID